MSDLISRSKLINDIATIFFSDKFNLDRLGRDLREIIDNQPTAYDIDKVVEELDKASYLVSPKNKGHYADNAIDLEDATKIVKQGIVSDDVCEWRLCDEEANVYDTSCRNPHILINGTPEESNYKFCPYCGKKIKVVE